jgi:hypothetical protein
MSIAKRVAEAFQNFHKKDPEGALMHICAAIEATATAEYAKEGRESYKRFLHENLGLVTKVALGGSIQNINLGYTHPHIKTVVPGLCSFEDLIYHAVRCGLYHQASIPADLHFKDEPVFEVDADRLVLPAKMVLGLIVAVVVAPVNKNESVTGDYHGLNLSGYEIPLHRLWGKRAELLDLYRAMDAIQK